MVRLQRILFCCACYFFLAVICSPGSMCTAEAASANAAAPANADQASGYPVESAAVAAVQSDEHTLNTVPMTLQEAIAVGLRHNRSVTGAYLSRIVQKFSLKVAEDEFVPNLDVKGNLNTSGSESSYTSPSSKSWSETNAMDWSFVLSEKTAIGGSLSLSLNSGYSSRKTKGSDRTDTEKWGWNFSFTQPLLKNAGYGVATASLRKARLSEESNVLGLKATLVSTVNSIISAYRSYQQARWQVDISKTSLERSKKQLEVNKLLIQAGRMAPMEIVQTQADIANREFSYEESLNSVVSARLRLIQVLDIDEDTPLATVEEDPLETVDPAFDEVLAVALANRTDYLQALIGLTQAQINLVLAENNMLITLDLESTYARNFSDVDPGSDSDASTWGLGLRLAAPLYGDLSRRQQLVSAKVALRNAQVNLKELEANLRVEVRDAVREVHAQSRQLQFSKQALELAKRKLEIEKEKLRLGRSTNFQVVSFENDLVSSQTTALQSMINYRNAVTNLNQTMGVTLETWSIEFRETRETMDDVNRQLQTFTQPQTSAGGTGEQNE